jgi:hypothetical protein
MYRICARGCQAKSGAPRAIASLARAAPQRVAPAFPASRRLALLPRARNLRSARAVYPNHGA